MVVLFIFMHNYFFFLLNFELLRVLSYRLALFFLLNNGDVITIWTASQKSTMGGGHAAMRKDLTKSLFLFSLPPPPSLPRGFPPYYTMFYLILRNLDFKSNIISTFLI